MSFLYIHKISKPTEQHIPVPNSVFTLSERPSRVVFVGLESPLSDLDPRLFGMAFAKADVVDVYQAGPKGMRRSFMVVKNMREIAKPYAVDDMPSSVLEVLIR